MDLVVEHSATKRLASSAKTQSQRIGNHPLYLKSRVGWRSDMLHAGATGRSSLGPLRPRMSVGRRAPPRPNESEQLPGPDVR